MKPRPRLRKVSTILPYSPTKEIFSFLSVFNFSTSGWISDATAPRSRPSTFTKTDIFLANCKCWISTGFWPLSISISEPKNIGLLVVPPVTGMERISGSMQNQEINILWQSSTQKIPIEPSKKFFPSLSQVVQQVNLYF